jgi:DNA-binding CsgD family transcriptional regulator
MGTPYNKERKNKMTEKFLSELKKCSDDELLVVVNLAVSQLCERRDSQIRKSAGDGTFSLKPVQAPPLSKAEKKKIGAWARKGISLREMARRLGRSPSTVIRYVNGTPTNPGLLRDWRTDWRNG